MSLKNQFYNIAPVSLQNIICSVYGYKEAKKRFGKDFKKKLDWLIESQWMTKTEIEQYQTEKLIELVNYAHDNTVYYKKVFAEHGLKPSHIQSLDDLAKIPVLTKEAMRANWNDILVPDYKGKVFISHTSGSTGKALDFYVTQESVEFQWAVWWRFRDRFSVKLGEKSLNFTGKLVVPINQKSPPYWRHNKAIDQYLVNMQHIKPENMSYFVDFINSNQFKFFSGYPSIIYSMAKMIETSSLKITHGPKWVFTGAETLYDNQKATIDRVFNTVTVDHYGFSEGAGNASKCENHVFHEDFEFCILEGNNIEKLSESEVRGDLIATGFSNWAMPMIRYQVGDSAKWSIEACSCGRETKVIPEVEGRMEDYVLTPEGTRILRFDYLFKDLVEVKECQVIQRKEGEVVFRIVKRDTYSISNEKMLLDLVKEWISPTIEVSFEYVDEIPRTASGKFKAVLSELNKNN